jgi:ATP-binding cassette subfamily F protein 3
MFSFIGPTDNFLVVLKRELEFEDALGKSNGELNKVIDKDAISQRLDEIYKRLDVIDADSAESRAASILAVSS